MRKEFKMSLTLTDADLYKIFGSKSRHVLGCYFIDFNGTTLRGDTPSELFEKVKLDYKNYVNKTMSKLQAK